MAEKISTIILKVDLDCPRCYKKIRKTLCKLQDRENIQMIAYDDKNKTVTICGPFCPRKLVKILNCKAYKCILEIEIKEHVNQKPKETQQAKLPPPPPNKKKAETAELTAPPKLGPVYLPVLPVCLAGHACRCNWEFCCGPCGEGHGGGGEHRRPCSCGCGGDYTPCYCGCGRGYVWRAGGPPVYATSCSCGGGDHTKICHLICEDEPTICSTM